MHRIIKSLVALLALSLVFSACGGGGGGGGGGGVTTTSGVQTGSFTKEVAFTGASTCWGINPEERVMNLYLAGDIKGSGIINSVSVKHALPSAGATCSSFTIKMGHTIVSSLSPTYADNIEQGQGSFQTVRSGIITISSGTTGDYFSIPLSQPFNYNGVDNLVADVTFAGCTGSVHPFVHQTSYPGVVYAASSTATNGTVSSFVTDAKFHFAGGDDISVGLSGGGSNYIPFRDLTNNDQKVQLLFTAGEIGGSGPITGIAFPAGVATAGGNYTINVRMGHTNLTSLTTGAFFADSFNVGTPVTVASGVSFSVPANVPVDSYVWIPMPSASFNYNGTNNLIVEIEVTIATAWTAWKTNNTVVSNRRLYAAAGASTGTADNSYYCIKFRFAGGTMDIIGDGSFGSAIFSNVSEGRQFLLRSAELGTAGSINRFACRLYSTTSTAASYPNFAVTLAHTTQSALVADDATNIAGGTVVYNGTFNVPAGLVEGDWVEIPFSAPFSYNGIDNLVVQTTTGAGTALNHCQFSGLDATRFNDLYKYTGGAAPADRRGVVRFWVNK